MIFFRRFAHKLKMGTHSKLPMTWFSFILADIYICIGFSRNRYWILALYPIHTISLINNTGWIKYCFTFSFENKIGRYSHYTEMYQPSQFSTICMVFHPADRGMLLIWNLASNNSQLPIWTPYQLIWSLLSIVEGISTQTNERRPKFGSRSYGCQNSDQLSKWIGKLSSFSASSVTTDFWFDAY